MPGNDLNKLDKKISTFAGLKTYPDFQLFSEQLASENNARPKETLLDFIVDVFLNKQQEIFNDVELQRSIGIFFSYGEPDKQKYAYMNPDEPLFKEQWQINDMIEQVIARKPEAISLAKRVGPVSGPDPIKTNLLINPEAFKYLQPEDQKNTSYQLTTLFSLCKDEKQWKEQLTPAEKMKGLNYPPKIKSILDLENKLNKDLQKQRPNSTIGQKLEKEYLQKIKTILDSAKKDNAFSKFFKRLDFLNLFSQSKNQKENFSKKIDEIRKTFESQDQQSHTPLKKTPE